MKAQVEPLLILISDVLNSTFWQYCINSLIAPAHYLYII